MNLRLVLVRIQLKLTDLLERYPALGLLLCYGFGRCEWLGSCCLAILIILCRPPKVKIAILMIIWLMGWGVQQRVEQSEQYWETCLESHGFLRCSFRWEKDVYQQDEGDRHQGWAKVWPLDENEEKGHGKRMWVKVSSGSTNSSNTGSSTADSDNTSSHKGHGERFPKAHFSGAQWQGWLTIWPERSMVFADTSAMENPRLFGWLAWRRWCIIQLETSWQDLAPEARGLLRSLLTGYRSELTPAVQHDFQRLGLMALLAISGLHLALLFGLIMWLGRRWSWTKWVALSLALCYAMLGGWNVPLFRSWGMLALCVTSVELRRSYSSLNALAFMAFLEHLGDPHAHLNLSFQLSYLGVLGILWMLYLPWPRLKLKSADLLFKAYLCSWGAMLWTWPIGLATFGNIPSWGWLFGPLCFASFGLLLGYVLLLGAMSALVALPNWACQPILVYNETLAEVSSRYAWITSSVAGDPKFLICYYLGLLGLTLTWRREPKSRFDIY